MGRTGGASIMPNAGEPLFTGPGGVVVPSGGVSGYGVPTAPPQQVQTPTLPSGLTGVSPQNPALTQAGFSPLNAAPDFGRQMGGVSAYKSTMK
jgi:hypothetical protein